MRLEWEPPKRNSDETIEKNSPTGTAMLTCTEERPGPVQRLRRGSYAHGVEIRPGARIIHVSGQAGVTPLGELSPDFKEQCRQSLINLQSVLVEGDMGLDDVVKLTFFLVRRHDIAGLVEVRRELLFGIGSAITTVFVAGLVSPHWLVEVEAIACAS